MNKETHMTENRLERLWRRHLEKWSGIALVIALMGTFACLKLVGVIEVPWYLIALPVVSGVVAFPFIFWKIEIRRRY